MGDPTPRVQVSADECCARLKKDMKSGPGMFLNPPGVLTAAMRWVPVKESKPVQPPPLGPAGAIGRAISHLMRGSRDPSADKEAEDCSSPTCGNEEGRLEPDTASTSTATGEAGSTTPTLTSDFCAAAETCSSPVSVSDVTCSPPGSPGRALQDEEFADWTVLHTDPLRASSLPESPPASKTWATITQEALSALGNA
ncbi:unnamed protein product [Symbiodinium pilosum]|uniref:Uncharacterized protein n=1 Tax=Symbiodinium pilosum TaxID=2952 RepID=A0A812X115_SYMPI|nr:unnamed protein product [Symbiodinium pilosum]